MLRQIQLVNRNIKYEGGSHGADLTCQIRFVFGYIKAILTILIELAEVNPDTGIDR